MQRYKAWEIWLANVTYEDKPIKTKRPVLVVPADVHVFLMVKMTKAEPRDEYEHRIAEWRLSGLLMETTIRTGKLLRLTDTDMVHKLGDLHPVDVVAFQTKLSAYLHSRHQQNHQYIHNKQNQ